MPILRRSNVEFDKWREFRLAINEMINNGSYKSLVDIHGEMVRDPDGLNRTKYRMHGSMYGPVGFRRFLGWHRAFLIAIRARTTARQLGLILALLGLE